MSRIGQGGMGVVYRAVDDKSQEDVALKLLRSDLQREPMMVHLFEDSARVQQSFNHEHIAPILEIGRWNEMSYITQPYYAHLALNRWFRQIDLHVITEIFRQVCFAVQYAHKNGVVHGDIKPSNVLVNSDGRAVLTDFVSSRKSSLLWTSLGFRLGTPGYMSQELLTTSQQPSEVSDVFALGVLLYEAIKGYLPRQMDERVSIVGSILPDLPLSLDPNYEWLNDVIRRAIDDSPIHRFAGVGEMIDAIRQPLYDYVWPEFNDSSSRAWLKFQDRRADFVLKESTYSIGSSQDCDIVIRKRGVSEQHAEIEFRDGVFLLRRMADAVSLTINSEAVRISRVLHQGDLIRVGDYRIRFGDPRLDKDTTRIRFEPLLPLAWLTGSRNAAGMRLEIRDDSLRLVDQGEQLVEIQPRSGKLLLVSKGSGMHVMVNDRRIQSTLLEENDTIECEDKCWKVQYAYNEWMEVIDKSLLKHGNVSRRDLYQLPNDCVLIAMQEYASRRADLDISLENDDLHCNDLERLRLLFQLWEDTQSMFDRRVGTGVAAELVALIREKLLVAQENTVGGLGSRHGPFIAFDLDISSVVHGLNLPNRIPLVLAQCAQFSPDDFPSLLRAVQVHVHSPHLAIIVFMDETTRVLLLNVVEQLGQHGINALALGREDMQRVLFSRDPRGSLRRMLLSKTDLSVISPFVVVGPVRRQLFFGREAEMGRIAANVSNASFALVAGRRYGKTSTLQRLHNELLSTAGYHTLLYDCSRIDPSQPLSACVVDDWKPGTPPNAPTNLDDLLQWPPLVPMVLLLDEADRLVMIDRRSGWRTLSILRALANAGRCQVILGGERAVHEAILDPSTPLFNFVTRIPLGPLDFNAVEELITRPFRQMEIGFSDEKEVVRRCFEFTSGHPNIVQRLCARLVTTLNLHNTRQITLDDVDEVIADPKFQEEDFLKTYWSQASDLEQIITLLMAGDCKPIRLRTILDLLASEGLQPDPVVVKGALDRLVDLRAILRRLPSGYEFAIAAFPQVLANTATAEDLLPVLKSQYRQNPHDTMESAKSHD